MNIAVCMKQVPAYSDGNMDEKTGLIIRAGVPSIANIYDMSALELALQMKELTDAVVTVFTMGPESAEKVIREAFACGADRGYLISDRAFSGADVLATSYTLARAMEHTGDYDLIICGKQTTDGDTAQVSGALAKWMDMPHLTGVSKFKSINEKTLVVWSVSERESLELSINYPCLLAVERCIATPRMPTLKLKMEGKRKEIPKIGLHELSDQNPEHYGLKGSATKVKKIFPPKRTEKQEVEILQGKEAALQI